MDKNAMVKYENSQFNAFFENDDGVYLIYNTLNLKLYRVKKDVWDFFKSSHSQQNIEQLDDTVVDRLYKEGLITKSTSDEKKLMEHIIYSTIYENKLNVTIIPTEACNFRCVYCYEPHDNNHMTDEVEQSIMKFFQKHIRKYKSVAIDWFGGEPLLQKNRVIRIMHFLNELCKENGIPLNSTIVTNGYLLDVDLFDTLVENKVLYYQITLDSTKELHDQRRPYINGAPTYDTIFQNIVNIKKYSKHKFFRITIRSNIGKNDSQAYLDFLKRMKLLIGEDSRFVFSYERIHDWGGDSVKKLHTEIDSNVTGEFQSLLKEMFSKDVNVFSDDFNKLSVSRCSAGKANGFLVNYDGTLYKCGMTFCGSEENKEIGHIGLLKSNGNLCIDEMKNAKFLSLSQPYERCNYCPWLPRCLLWSCPLASAKGDKIRCIKEYRESYYLESTIWNNYTHGNYVDLLEGGCQIGESKM